MRVGALSFYTLVSFKFPVKCILPTLPQIGNLKPGTPRNWEGGVLTPWMFTLRRDGSRGFGKGGSWVLKTKGLSSNPKDLYALQRETKGLSNYIF